MEALIREPAWFYPLSQIRKTTRSRLDGVSFTDELLGQSKGVQFITRMAIPLRLPPQTIFAAALFLHRFYIRHSLKRGHPYEIAAACLFLACKTEESSCKLHEVAVIATKIGLKLPPTVHPSEVEHRNAKEVDKWTQRIRTTEDELLQALKFDFEDTSPYEHLNKLVHSYVPPEHHKLLGSTATFFINDSCLTMLSLSCSMPDLAVAALYWASVSTKTPIPSSNNEKWYAGHLGRADILRIISDMAEMMPVVQRSGVEVRHKYEKIA